MANLTDASQNKVRTAEEVNFEVARGMAQIVRSTLGPLGRDKMMVDSSGRTVITNDGATILRETNFTHPTAALIVGVARTQESESYDGNYFGNHPYWRTCTASRRIDSTRSTHYTNRTRIQHRTERSTKPPRQSIR